MAITYLSGGRIQGIATDRTTMEDPVKVIESSGGGAGTSYNAQPNGFAGGSGGGSGNDRTGGAGNTGGYSPVEGYAGGNGDNASGGGGGGASEVGENAGVDSTNSGGDGGDGLNNAILTGSNITYAGGGGAGVNTSSQTVGDGGSGGGGAAGTYGSAAGTNGTDGLGGGGGAAGSSSYTAGNGGSGVVILRFSGTDYTATGNLTPTTVAGETVVQWTSSGTFTPTASFNVEYLVVAGGGGAGNTNAGGGGGGGYRTNYDGTALGVTAQVYTITVGDGGVGAATGGQHYGINGEDSGIYEPAIPTTLPVGTRYEETDTRKIFRRAEHTTSDLGTAANVAEVGSVTAQSTNKLLGSNALDLDGASGTYINMNNILNCMTTTGTISFWARSEGTSAYTIAWSDTNGLSYFHITNEHSPATCRVDMTVSNTVQWKIDSASGSWGSTDRGWKHIVLTQDGTAAKFYFNGTEQTSFTTTTDKSKWISHVTTAGADNVRWGAKDVYNQGIQGNINGQLDDFAIWSRAITAAEVAALYNGGTGALATSISGTGMKVYYSCNSLSGSTLVNECPATTLTWVEKGTA
jgi:hypothetical protein